ncbi:hypothetical protein [Mycobacteroides sp. LB1]|uniref:hypothetical protein n=1 Tax=Mycobacteroides sp. LB1 TaxID=2750814 RepID=UPI00352DDD06
MIENGDPMSGLTVLQTVTPPVIPADAHVMTAEIGWPPGSAGTPPMRCCAS